MPTKPYDDFLRQELCDNEIAAEYLSTSLAEGAMDQFLLALRKVAEAHGGLGALAEITDLNRQSMYKMLSGHGNPNLRNLISILKALGIELVCRPIAEEPVIQET